MELEASLYGSDSRFLREPVSIAGQARGHASLENAIGKKILDASFPAALRRRMTPGEVSRTR
jgi:hypothetical protein